MNGDVAGTARRLVIKLPWAIPAHPLRARGTTRCSGSVRRSALRLIAAPWNAWCAAAWPRIPMSVGKRRGTWRLSCAGFGRKGKRSRRPRGVFPVQPRYDGMPMRAGSPLPLLGSSPMAPDGIRTTRRENARNSLCFAGVPDRHSRFNPCSVNVCRGTRATAVDSKDAPKVKKSGLHPVHLRELVWRRARGPSSRP